MSQNSKSSPYLIRNLWEEGFFSDARNLSEISDRLANQGYHISAAILSTSLIRLVKSKNYLGRTKKFGVWRYIQKYPTSSSLTSNSDFATNYDFHPRIKEVSFKHFKDGYFKEAIQNALVEVIDQVKIRTKHPKGKNGRDLEGDDLMNHVFGCDNQDPKIKFNSLRTGLDKAEQRGLMNLYKGIVGIRDRKAHLNFIQNDPRKTIEYLSLASLLLRLLDEQKNYN